MSILISFIVGLSSPVAGADVNSTGVDCNTLQNCGDCAQGVSWSGTPCRWCPKDGGCHAYDSVYNTCSSSEQITDPVFCPSKPPVGYSEARALEYVNFAAAAYCSPKSLEAWSCGKKCSADVSSVTVCNGDHTKAFVGLWEGKCLVSFEGTSDIGSALKDLEITKSAASWDVCEDCLVHTGFLAEYNSVRQCVQTALKGTGCPPGAAIRTTGHSLGASMNSLAMIDLTDAGWVIEESYDFGKPRTGDANFAAAHKRLFQDKPIWRLTHAMDPVPQVPPTDLIVDWHFVHVEPEIYYPGDVIGGYQKCTADDHSGCAEQYWNVPIDLLHIVDHLDYMGAQTSTFGCDNGFEEDDDVEQIVV